MGTRSVDLVVAKVLSEPWAILPRRGRAILSILARRYAGKVLNDEAIADAVGADVEARAVRAAATTDVGAGKGIAVIPVYGAIVNRAYEVENISGSGLLSAEALGKTLRRAAADPAVSTIVLDIDSPGGSVGGLPELCSIVATLGKPTVAVANGLAASAAYWLAASCNELVVTPSGEVGSIGVYTMHEDWSKALEAEGVRVTYIFAGDRKVDGNPTEPLSDAAREEAQSQVDAFREMFVKDVAAGRGVSVAEARGPKFGEGSTFLAKDAVAAGLADRVATLDETIARLQAGGRVRTRRRAETLSAPVGKGAAPIGEVMVEIPSAVAEPIVAEACVEGIAVAIENATDLRVSVERAENGQSITVRAAPRDAATTATALPSADLADLEFLAIGDFQPLPSAGPTSRLSAPPAAKS